MSGKDLKLKKFFRGKKNLVISALDHVVVYGVQKGIEESAKAIENCITTDALLMPRFMLKNNWEKFTLANAPTPVVRINWSSSFYYPLNYKGGYTVDISTIEEAVEAGAEVIICSLFIENENEKMETENVKLFSEIVRQKERLGIPLIGECYIVEHMDKTKDEVHDKVKRVSRIIVELGADMVKTFYTGERFHEVVENTPAPIFTIGAEKLNTDLDVLKKAHDSIIQGARGIIFGRNIFMAEDPVKMVKALNEVLNDGSKPEEAAEKYGLK